MEFFVFILHLYMYSGSTKLPKNKGYIIKGRVVCSSKVCIFYEPYCIIFSLLLKMKPSTEIFKKDVEKKRLRQASSHLKEHEKRKRRFKPQRFKSAKINHNSTAKTNSVTDVVSDQKVPTSLFIPDSFPKFDINKTKIGEIDKLAANQSKVGQRSEMDEG